MNVEEILQSAKRQSGLEDLPDDHTLEGLGIFVEAANNEAGLSEIGDQRLSGLLTTALANRLQVEDYLKKNPQLIDRPVKKPMFVFGLPRTGTTLTINLLSQDPARRYFQRWEAFKSLPPPTPDFRQDPRFIEEQAQIDLAVKYKPELSAIHHEDADSPTECQLSMVQTMCSQVLEALVHVPGYRDWFHQTSYLPAFRYHKRLLQLLQSQFPGRWTLKNPWHPLFLDDLTIIYPDAQLVMNHRDPVDVMGSACSMIKHVRSSYTDNVDNKLVATTLLDTFDRMIQKTLAYKKKHGWESIYDLQYVTLMKDPIGEMQKLYARFDEPFTSAAKIAMERFQERNPKGKHGSHKYDLEEFGLTRKQVREHFRDYCDNFEIPTGD